MEYILIILFQLLGIGFHVAQKLIQLDNLSPDDSFGAVMKLFWNEDRVTIFISSLILVLNVAAHFVIESYAPELRAKIEYYALYSFAIALVLGYGGQRLVYKYLGKAEALLDKQADKIQ